MADKAITFGSNLRALRKKFGYTRAQLAQIIAYSEKSIEKWESSSSIPPVMTLCDLAEHFGVSVDALIFSKDTEVRYLLGIDGGGTKTEFLLTDLKGEEIRRMTLGPTNPVDIGMDLAKKTLEQGILQLCREIDRREISMFAGLAGGISGDYQKRINHFLSGFGFRLYANGSDTENALETALHGQRGVAIIMGTGVVAFAQDGETRHRIGGWGYLIDQGGSGYNLGADALNAALKDFDGREGSPALHKLVEQQLGKALPDAIPDIYQGSKTCIAAFAPLVFTAYAQGDRAAERIIDRNVREVAEIIRVGRRMLGDPDAHAVICGGLAHQSDIHRPFFERHLGQECAPEFLSEPMVNGAVSLARAQLEKRGGEEV